MFKTSMALLVMLALCASTESEARAGTGVVIALPTDGISMEPIAGEVFEVRSEHNVLKVELSFVAKNCVDQVTPVIYSRIDQTVAVSVWNVSRKLSYWAPCARFPVYRQVLVLPPDMKRPFLIEFIGTEQSILIE